MQRTAIVVLVASLLGAGCDWFENPAPDQAQLIIQGEAGKRVRLIVSTDFVAAVNEQGQTRVVIIASDTLVTTLPYERTYRIDDDQRFFAEAARLDEDLETVRMEVYLDNSKRFDESGILIEGSPYRFVYTFNQAITQEIVVL